MIIIKHNRAEANHVECRKWLIYLFAATICPTTVFLAASFKPSETREGNFLTVCSIFLPTLFTTVLVVSLTFLKSHLPQNDLQPSTAVKTWNRKTSNIKS